MFPENSRYHTTEIAKRRLPDGREVSYLRRRFLPLDPGALLAEHIVKQNDRLDNITAHYLGDPKQFWRVCDVNTAMQPDALTAEDNIGHFLRIPIPLSQGGI